MVETTRQGFPGRSAEELVTRHRRLPQVDGELMRHEADGLLGGEDRVGEAGPRERPRG
ncbi:hypothetical protein [Streptomyces sp. NPDC057682]|uniref:hypothetical protein n=1 Tax=unclassified Streptomyces TaxID=2593676 RepID=UPI00365B796F